LKKLTPISPWKRILKEHFIDVAIGVAIGIWLADMMNFGLIEYVKELGGLVAIASAFAIIHRIFFNGDSKKNK
jgi:hypothetical protein